MREQGVIRATTVDVDPAVLDRGVRRLYAIDGVSGTQATLVLETFFERPVHAG